MPPAPWDIVGSSPGRVFQLQVHVCPGLTASLWPALPTCGQGHTCGHSVVPPCLGATTVL